MELLLELLSLVPCFMYFMLKSSSALHMLQQNWYNDGNRYIGWILKNINKVFVEIDLFFVVLGITIFLEPKFSIIIFEIFYALCFFMYKNKKEKEQVKKP